MKNQMPEFYKHIILQTPMTAGSWRTLATHYDHEIVYTQHATFSINDHVMHLAPEQDSFLRARTDHVTVSAYIYSSYT